MSKLQQNFDEQINSMTIAHEKTTPVDPALLETTMARIANPVGAVSWANDFMRPEQRVYCIDCRKPIMFEAKKCPFCDAQQPNRETMDLDEDGMIDDWERSVGLDSMDPADASQDKDGDKFSNLAEFRYKTNPGDPKEYPPVVSELILQTIRVRKFPMKFEGKVLQADGSYRFQLNLGGKTHFVVLNDVIGSNGWKVASYEAKTARIKTATGTRDEDVSRLTLTKGKKRAVLIYRKGVEFKEYVATLKFNITGKSFRVIDESTFEIMNEKFMVISIDMNEKRVLIRALDGGKETFVTLPGQGETPAPPAAAPDAAATAPTPAEPAATTAPGEAASAGTGGTVVTEPDTAEKESAPAESQEAETTANQNEDAP